MEKAVLYAVGNTLVCDKLDEAKTLSWSGERYKGKGIYFLLILKQNFSFPCLVKFLCLLCYHVLSLVVTVDGILLTKSGTMTGGISGGMEARSNKWDDSRIECLYCSISLLHINRCVLQCLAGS